MRLLDASRGHVVLAPWHPPDDDNLKPRNVRKADSSPVKDPLSIKHHKESGPSDVRATVSTTVRQPSQSSLPSKKLTTPTNSNLERRGSTLRLLLKQIVQAKVKDGNEMCDVGPIKELHLVKVLYDGMKQDIEIILHHPEDIASWQQPPHFAGRPWCFLVKEAEIWIRSRAYMIESQIRDASIPKIARRTVLNVVSRLGKELQEMVTNPDWDPGQVKQSKTKPTIVEVVHQTLPGPLKDVVQRVVAQQFLDFDKETRDALVKVLLRIGMESVQAALEAPQDLGTGEKPSSDQQEDCGDLVCAYEDVLQLSLEEPTANPERLRVAAEQLAWSSRSRLDVLINGLLEC